MLISWSTWWEDGILLVKWVHMLMQTGYGCKWDQERGEGKFPLCLHFSPHLTTAGKVETLARRFLLRCPLPEPPDWDWSYRWQISLTLSVLTTHRRRHLMLIPEVTGLHWWTASLIGLLGGGGTDQPCESQIDRWKQGRAGCRGWVEVFWKGRRGIGG